MQQPERIFRELCCVKKASPQRLRTTWFHLYNLLEMTQLQTWTDLWLPGWKREGQLVVSGCGYPKGSIKDLCGDRTVLYPDCIELGILIVIWYYSFARCYYLGKLGKGYMRSLCIISSTCMRIYNYLKRCNFKKSMCRIICLICYFICKNCEK